MTHRPVHEHDAALLTPSEMAEADRLAEQDSRIPAGRLMAAAGWAVARAARRFGPCRTTVLCGPGKNGGDGFVAARLLMEAGWPVQVAQWPPSSGNTVAGLHGDAARAAARWRGPTVPFGPQAVAGAGLVIDAVFGAGLSRAVDGVVADTLRAAGRVLAVDMPSGVDGATGQISGFAPQAALTVTFFRRKPGHLLYPGRQLCGETVLADIGIPAAVLATIGPRHFQNGPALWTLPALGAQSHKYTRGHVTVLGGAMAGAARLAADAARHGGAGMVTIAAQDEARYRAVPPGIIVSDKALDILLADDRRKVWVCGPGLGADDAAAALPRLMAAGRQVVGDADLFTAFAGRPDALRGCAVLTPHEGEFGRVFGRPGPDRVAAVRDAARLVGGVVLLKGASTIVAAPDGRVAINASAPPYLATAGSGDVLSGLIAGLLATGLPPWQAANAGAWLHGRAGWLAGPGLVAEDLPPAIPQAIASVTADR